MDERYVDTVTTYVPAYAMCLHHRPLVTGLAFRTPRLLKTRLSSQCLNLLRSFLRDALAVSP